MLNDVYFKSPVFGGLYAHREEGGLRLWEIERLPRLRGHEWLIYCGTVRIYLTPPASVRNEGRYPKVDH